MQCAHLCVYTVFLNTKPSVACNSYNTWKGGGVDRVTLHNNRWIIPLYTNNNFYGMDWGNLLQADRPKIRKQVYLES